MRNMRWMGALALIAVALLVLGSMACNKSEDTGSTESTPTDQMPSTEGTTSDTTGSMTGTMSDTTGGTMGATDDATLQTNVQNAIAAQPNMSGVTVTVSMGTATLSGTVASDTEKMAAETAAKGVPGVTAVVNNLTVGSAAPAAK